MKKLILFLFTVIFSFSVNAQDLSFKTFNKTVKPKGNLAVTVETNMGRTTDYYYQEWSNYSLIQWKFSVESGRVSQVSQQTAFYDELEIERAEISKDDSVFEVWIPIKKSKEAVLRSDYLKEQYDQYTADNLRLTVKTRQDGDDLIAKLKDKAFDMGLDLDADVKRVNLRERVVFNEKYPTGIAYTELKKIEDSETPTETKTENSSGGDSKSVNLVRVTLKHTSGERYYLLINGVENVDCTNQTFSFTHSKYGEETRTYTFCEGQKLIEKNTGRVIFTATKTMDGTTYKIK